MANLTIVANIHAKPDQIDLVKAELLTLIPHTRKEAGCVKYDLHRDNEDPAHFIFIEQWESQALLQAHMESGHIAAYLAATECAVTEFTIGKMTYIG